MDNEASRARAELYYGALLHDIGKVVIRATNQRVAHPILGAQFLQDIGNTNEAFSGPEGNAVIEQVRYHHAEDITKSSTLADDSLAFITYFADNISAGMDRKNEGDETWGQFDPQVDMRKIFNILNGHHDDNVIPHGDYNAIQKRIRHHLSGATISLEEVNSLENLLEATCWDVPSSTNVNQLVDVSLFDHLKTTAGIAACIYDYLQEQGITNYRAALFAKKTADRFYNEPMFLLLALDLSGIQAFIYNISGSGALKQLRARSWYLEMLLEHIVDELLARMNLCRPNLLYTGGGGAYLLLPNTHETQNQIDTCMRELREWLLDNFTIDLYCAYTMVPCSANDLANEGNNPERFANLFRTLSRQMSAVKQHRYNGSLLRELNFSSRSFDRERECNECHRSDVPLLDIGGEVVCERCAGFRAISAELIKPDHDVFVVIPASDVSGEKRPQVKLPFDSFMYVCTPKDYLQEKPQVKRVYTKNRFDMGIKLATHIWMGDYTADTGAAGMSAYETRSTTLEQGKGIPRLGVLRADVDNLGLAFSNGFPADKASISRTATLSRELSYFFKFQINEILKRGADDSPGYEAQIIYSGGDDMFIVGNWADVIAVADDIRLALDEFTGNGALTLSAGIGMFSGTYPISRMAQDVGELEDAAKLYVSAGGRAKDAIALWSTEAGSIYSWDDFINGVIPLEAQLEKMFAASQAKSDEEKGNAFIYRIVGLLRETNNVSALPRLAYTLARSFESAGEKGNDFARQLFSWAQNPEDRKKLITALELYVYRNRERG